MYRESADLVRLAVAEPLAADVLGILTPELERRRLVELDGRFPGWGFSNVDDPQTGSGRYRVEDRALFRPFQYAGMASGNPNNPWYARYVVHNMGGHVEACLERRAALHGASARGTLGQVLDRLRPHLAVDLYEAAALLGKAWNQAKHDWDQEPDTHMFSVQDAWAFYFAARALGLRILPQLAKPTPR